MSFFQGLVAGVFFVAGLLVVIGGLLYPAKCDEETDDDDSYKDITGQYTNIFRVCNGL